MSSCWPQAQLADRLQRARVSVFTERVSVSVLLSVRVTSLISSRPRITKETAPIARNDAETPPMARTGHAGRPEGTRRCPGRPTTGPAHDADRKDEAMDVTVALLVTLEAKPGKEEDVAGFLEGGRSLVEAEPDTVSWYAFRQGQTTFGIFDTFANDDGRQKHLSGEVAKALGQITEDLLAAPPDIRPVDLVAAMLPR
jgi:quinol monooxygenase YgiN